MPALDDLHLAPDEEGTIFQSPTFDHDITVRVNEPIGSATIAPSGRDVALASKHGLYIIDLDSSYAPPRHIRHETPWTPADVQWSPFASRHYWIVSTSNQRALVWNLGLGSAKAPIEFVLHAHQRAITDINFSPFHPDVLATCAVDGFVHTWDLRIPARPAISFSDWFAGATQVKWNRADSHIVASSHDRFLRIWDDRKGAIPLTSIEAHPTKIYGLDWSRHDATKIITSALDRTIKLWDHSISEVHPERIIRTPYPVWRARFTPFGTGIMAMPQRGDHRLHLFSSVFDEGTPHDSHVDPIYSFRGHTDSVKEFLWRARGTMQDGRDERDFQLVSWGSDHQLIMHRMRDRYLSQVGYEKGMHVKRFYPLTRRGAPYISYKDPITTDLDNPAHLVWQGKTHGDDSSQLNSVATMTRPSKDKADEQKSTSNVITWIKGVKFGRSKNRRIISKSSQVLQRVALQSHSRETLSDEVIHINETFKRITFEEIDVKARHVVVSLYAPWGDDDKTVFVEVDMTFPQGYPQSAAPRFKLTKSSTISAALIDQLQSDLVKIGEAHKKHHVGCLESAFYYLMREKNLKQSTSWLSEDGIPGHQGDSSSDEDDALGNFGNAQSSILEPAGTAMGGVMGSDANVPLPRGCGATWAPNGKLVCFFPPLAQPQSLFEKIRPSGLAHDSSDVMLEGLGRLAAMQAPSRAHSPISDTTPEMSDSASSGSTSSSGSDDEVGLSSFTIGPLRSRAFKASALRRTKLGSISVDGSQQTSRGHGRLAPPPKPKTIISIQNHDDVLPCKRELGSAYMVLGPPSVVCDHNRQVALRHGLDDIADIWSLLSHIVTKDIPLTALPSYDQSIIVVARRALVRIERQDSGFDLSFDEPESVLKPDLWGNLRWGGHPFGAAWLIKELFSFFERRADVQMLALLSCMLDDARLCMRLDEESVTVTSNLHSDCWPGMAMPYVPDMAAAATIKNPVISVSDTGAHGPSFSFGSVPSSEGSRSYHDQSPIQHKRELTALSTSSTPPVLSRSSTGRLSLNASMSVSPESTLPPQSSVTSSFRTAAFAYRPFRLASSPPSSRKRSLAEETLATSLPSSTSRVTWASGTTIPGRDRYDEDGSTDNDEGYSSSYQSAVRVKRTNVMSFEDEGCADVPLLSGHATRYAAYREGYASMLEAWGLFVPATEIRKFNVNIGLPLIAADAETVNALLFDDDSKSQITMVAHDHYDELYLPRSFPIDGLTVTRCCEHCGLVDASERRRGAKCPQCNKPRRVLACSVCAEPIQTLHKSCFNCGHVAHMSCLEDLQLYREEEPMERRLFCEAGCGCACRFYTELMLEEATTTTTTTTTTTKSRTGRSRG